MNRVTHVAEKLALVAFPRLLLEGICNYFRIEVEGIEHLPRRGKALVAPNHSGCSGLDAVMLGYVIQKEIQRLPRILALWTYFEWLPALGNIAKKMGLQKASSKNGINLLRKNNLTILFPEGVAGSFKPSCDRYQLQPFHTGFIRMALLSGSPLVPCVVIGAEESNINLGSIRLEKYIKGLALPVPLNLIPFPAKWKIQFLPPADLSGLTARDTHDKFKMRQAADKIRNSMQSVIQKELNKRNYVYFLDS